MKHTNRWIVFALLVASALLAACAQPSAKASKSQPVKVERIEGKASRLTLTTEAARRLDIQTALVREDQVLRKRQVGGQVVTLPDEPGTATGGTLVANPTTGGASAASSSGGALVRVALNASDLNKVDRDQPALVLPIASDKSPALAAQPVAAPHGADAKEAAGALYYALDSATPSLAPGQRVLVEMTLTGSGAQRKIIPYAALLYDQNGATWVYTNPEPLVFIRQPIAVDYIEGDRAILSDGPSAGTAVVIVGAAELFGAETGIGK